MHGDLPIGQVMGEAQLHRCATFGTQLLQYDAEPQDPLRRIQASVERRQRLEAVALCAGASSMSMPRARRRSSTACSFTRLFATV